MKPYSKKLKLKIELVPKTSWYNNLRNLLPRSLWDKIRKETFDYYNHKCGICGAEGKLNCHEIWEFDDKNHIQKLRGFSALCDMCHYVKHFGFATKVLIPEGKLDYKKLVEHFVKVNNCDEKTFSEHVKESFEEWRRRSKHKWYVDLGKYKKLIRGNSKKLNNI
jgi:hypothetical protein